MRGAVGRVRHPRVTRESCVPSRTHPLVLIHALEGVLGQRIVPVAQPGHHGTEELWGEAGQSRGAWGITPGPATGWSSQNPPPPSSARQSSPPGTQTQGRTSEPEPLLGPHSL